MNKVQELRKKAELTRDELAEILGVSKRTIEAIEYKQRNPSVKLANKMKEIFNCTLDEIYNSISKGA